MGAKGRVFSEALKEARAGAGLTQEALAERSGLTKQAVSFLEQGRRQPSWETVRQLARALGVSVAAFDR